MTAKRPVYCALSCSHATCDNTCAKAIEAEKRAEGRMREARLKRLE
jgi:hypothetical protein